MLAFFHDLPKSEERPSHVMCLKHAAQYSVGVYTCRAVRIFNLTSDLQKSSRNSNYISHFFPAPMFSSPGELP